MSHPFDLTGKVAAVTGANTGIGQAIALALASAGADIACVCRGESAEIVAQVAARGRRSAAIVADLSSSAPAERIVAETVERLGQLDILVNNAGTIRRGAAVDLTEDDWDAVVNTNLRTAFFLSQAAARQMIAAGCGGRIINVASMLSFQGGIRVASYTASKSGLAGLTKALANEWAPLGITVNAIAPGYIATNNTAALRSDVERERGILDRIPAGRWGEPGDLGGAAVFLASDAAAYVQGHVLAVDGGWLAR
jgi:2-dehydro-3-deoxy-D-gluconate 5-dehydrogenase